MKKYDYIVAIDPDCEKSGVAVLSTNNTRRMDCYSMCFPKLIEWLKEKKDRLDSSCFLVIVEAGWLNQSNWHIGRLDSKQKAAAMGNSVGRNHETGRKIVEMCKHYGIEVLEQKPLIKCWTGNDGKITHNEIQQFITSFPKKSNQEVRDAALIAWSYAGFPIRVKVK